MMQSDKMIVKLILFLVFCSTVHLQAENVAKEGKF